MPAGKCLISDSKFRAVGTRRCGRRHMAADAPTALQGYREMIPVPATNNWQTRKIPENVRRS